MSESNAGNDIDQVAAMEKQGDPWFDDGNLVIMAGSVGFKIHRGVLARQSEIFKDMLTWPQPSTTTDIETVCMYDLPVEISNLLKAIYDGVTFQNRDIEDFFFLASILRLSSKYFIAHLRRQAIEALAKTWSHLLEDHDAMVERAIQAPVGSDLTYPYVHPIHVLNLARETHIRVVIPSALYFLSMYPFADLVRGSHPKLTAESPSGLPRPSSVLSVEDMNNYTLMFQHRIEIMLDYVRRFLSERRSCVACQYRRDETDAAPPPSQRRPSRPEEIDPCSHTFARVASRASRTWFTRTGPLKWMLQTVQYLESDGMTVCARCKEAFKSDVESHRLIIWEALPGVVGMPNWQLLKESDLPELPQQ